MNTFNGKIYTTPMVLIMRDNLVKEIEFRDAWAQSAGEQISREMVKTAVRHPLRLFDQWMLQFGVIPLEFEAGERETLHQEIAALESQFKAKEAEVERLAARVKKLEDADMLHAKEKAEILNQLEDYNEHFSGTHAEKRGALRMIVQLARQRWSVDRRNYFDNDSEIPF